MVRFKNRWLLVEFIPVDVRPTNSTPVTSKTVWNALKESVILNFGETGWGAVGGSLTVKYFSPTTGICIIRVTRDHHRIAWGAVTLITSLDGFRYIPQTVHVSGTIKKAQLAAIQHDREVVARLRNKSKSSSSGDDFTAYLTSSRAEIEALQE